MPELKPRLKKTNASRLCIVRSIAWKSCTVSGASWRSISRVVTSECILQIMNLLKSRLCVELS